MNKIEEKICKEYRTKISKLVRSKYKKIAHNDAVSRKIYLEAEENSRKKIQELARQIYQTYEHLIDTEIESRFNDFVSSPKFKESVNREIDLQNKKLSYKSLKRYQDFKIGIDKSFIKAMLDEVNVDGEPEINEEELKYILLLILYKIIDYIRDGYKIKISTLCTIWIEKRDFRVNLPDVKSRILEDRLMPKLKLCKKFSYELFNEINKDNKAIINYCKAKLERFLILLKIKQVKNF